MATAKGGSCNLLNTLPVRWVIGVGVKLHRRGLKSSVIKGVGPQGLAQTLSHGSLWWSLPYGGSRFVFWGESRARALPCARSPEPLNLKCEVVSKRNSHEKHSDAQGARRKPERCRSQRKRKLQAQARVQKRKRFHRERKNLNHNLFFSFSPLALLAFLTRTDATPLSIVTCSHCDMQLVSSTFELQHLQVSASSVVLPPNNLFLHR